MYKVVLIKQPPKYVNEQKYNAYNCQTQTKSNHKVAQCHPQPKFLPKLYTSNWKSIKDIQVVRKKTWQFTVTTILPSLNCYE